MLLIGRDHLDCGSVASLIEKLRLKDGSDAVLIGQY